MIPSSGGLVIQTTAGKKAQKNYVDICVWDGTTKEHIRVDTKLLQQRRFVVISLCRLSSDLAGSKASLFAHASSDTRRTCAAEAAETRGASCRLHVVCTCVRVCECVRGCGCT